MAYRLGQFLRWAVLMGAAVLPFDPAAAQTLSNGTSSWTFTTNIGNGSFGVQDASVGARSDAFDGGLGLVVNGVAISGASPVVSGRNLSLATSGAAGLNIGLQYYLDAAITMRTLAVFHNPTGTVITVPVDMVTNLGSNNATTVAGTSSGDTVFTTADRWIVTDDNDDDRGDPAVTQVLYGPGSPAVTPASVGTAVFDSNGPEGVTARYQLTVNPGETARLMFFHQLNFTSADGLSNAWPFASNNALQTAQLLEGLSGEELETVRNWQFNSESVVPEPGAICLFLPALVLMAVVRRRKPS